MQIDNSNQASRIYHLNNTIAGNLTNASAPTRNEILTDTVTISDAGANAANKLQEIANKYDATNMSHSELTRMSSELQLNELISSQEGLAMRAPPSMGFDPDKRYDTVAAARKSVEFDQSLGSAQSKDAKLRASVLDVLETMQKLSQSASHSYKA